MPPSVPPAAMPPTLPAELMNRIMTEATSNGDFDTLRTLALVSHGAGEWADKELRRQVCVDSVELCWFMDLERPKLEALEVVSWDPTRKYRDHPRTFDEGVPLIPRNCPNLSRLAISAKYHHADPPIISSLATSLSRLPNLTTLHLDYNIDYCFADAVRPPSVFASLTHLYCSMGSWEMDGGSPPAVSPDCFPVLTHVALTMNNCDRDVDWDTGSFLERDGYDFYEAERASRPWLAIPSLRRLIFQWEKGDDVDNDEEFAEKLQEYLAENDLDDRVIYLMLDEAQRAFRRVRRTQEPVVSEEESCFDFLDRLWKLGEDAYERRKRIRAVGDQ